MGKYIIAHDLGTSGNKACLFDTDGVFISSSYTTYPVYYTDDNGAEQNPSDWWDAVRKSTMQVVKETKIDKEDVIAISFSSQGGALTPVDRDGNVLRERAMVWMDARAREEGELVLKEFGAEELFERTGSWTGYDKSLMAKMLWIKRHEPDVYEKTYKFLGCKEYVILKMTGSMQYTDYVGVAGFNNINTLEPDEDFLKFAGVDLDKFPKPTDCFTPIGTLKRDAAEDMGLSEKTLVVLGSWDNFACGVGGGATISGNSVTYLGTAGWIAVTDSKRLGSFTDRVGTARVSKDMYFYSFNSHSAGPAFNWIAELVLPNLKNELPGGAYYDRIEELARSSPAGANGIVHIPAYYGGNTFITDNRICGTFLGIKLTHGAADMMRAVMEGVVCDIGLGYRFFERNNIAIDKIRAIGGGSNNKLWLEMFAGLYKNSISVPSNQQHIGALGAMIMAGIGAGLYSDYSVSERFLKSVAEIQPKDEDIAVYERLSGRYAGIFQSIADLYCAE